MRVLQLTGLRGICTRCVILLAGMEVVVAVGHEDGLARLITDAVFAADSTAGATQPTPTHHDPHSHDGHEECEDKNRQDECHVDPSLTRDTTLGESIEDHRSPRSCVLRSLRLHLER